MLPEEGLPSKDGDISPRKRSPHPPMSTPKSCSSVVCSSYAASSHVPQCQGRASQLVSDATTQSAALTTGSMLHAPRSRLAPSRCHPACLTVRTEHRVVGGAASCAWCLRPSGSSSGWLNSWTGNAGTTAVLGPPAQCRLDEAGGAWANSFAARPFSSRSSLGVTE